MADRRAIRGRICHADDGVKRRHHLVAECVPKTSDDRQFATATLRNRDFIPDVLHDVLTMTGAVVEIASGSGEHFVHFARNFPTLAFQASDPEPDALLGVAAWVKAAGVENVRAPFALDASHSVWPIESADGIICINMVHISLWIKGAAAILPPASPLYLYGPHIHEGFATARATKDSIAAFAIATRAGVYETSKRSPRRRNPLDSRRRLSPKCPQTI